MSDQEIGDGTAQDEGWSRRSFLKGLGVAGLVTPVALSACADDGDGSESDSSTTSSSPRRRGQGSGSEEQPNFIVIVADDMRFDQLWSMSKVIELIQKPGLTFAQARCNVPLCQPSRVGMFTGQLSKHHGVIDIGFFPPKIPLDSFVAKPLADVGYQCALIGKFVNGVDAYGGTETPAGFSFWREIVIDQENDYFTIHDGKGLVQPKDIYPTDYFAQEAIKFLDGVEEPFALWLTPSEPHAPFTPREDLADRFSDYVQKVVDEVDVSDKPSWIQKLPPLTPKDIDKIRDEARGSLRELAAVDDMVSKVFAALDPDVLARTVVFFSSDNGTHRGEHRRQGPATKGGPYEVGLHVPMLVRGPGFESGPEVTSPVLMFQDITATMIDLAGATPALDHQAGVSLAAMAADPGAHAQRVLLHEISNPYYDTSGDGITTGPDHELGFRKLYRYPSVRSGKKTPPVFEAYDLDDDPDELKNWANDPSRRAERDRLEKILDDLLAAP